MPFRLLGLAVDPSRAGNLCGHSFAHYASVGVDVTLACLTSGDQEPDLRDLARLGIRHLVLLGLQPPALEGDEAQPMVIDLIAGLQPHVVVIDGSDEGLARATQVAVVAARRRLGGSSALPAKLYVRSPRVERPHEITSAVMAPALPAPELFARLYPQPWVTGVLERDLFGGISPEPGTFLDEVLAS